MSKRYNLVGVDGNAFSVMGYVTNAMKDAYRKTDSAHFGRDEQKRYQSLAMSSDYNNLLCVSVQMIDKINDTLGLEDEDDDLC